MNTLAFHKYFTCVLKVFWQDDIMMPLPAPPSGLLIGGFVVLAISLVATYAIALKSWRFGVFASLWLIMTGAIGKSGVLANFSSTPPLILLLLLLVFVGTSLLVLSRFGQRIADLPLTFLVGFLAFRVPIEFLIHRAVDEGVAPPQMTWTGMNFDILAGVSAFILIPFVKRMPRWGVLLWNSFALALLLWIVGIAVLSMPTALQQIKPDNVWVAWFPFIWLPTVAVAAALIGHFAIFRKLLANSEDC